MPKILIVDDEAIFRKGLRSMITAWDSEWEVVGDARDGYEALERVEELAPDAILTDIRMPRMDGLQLQQIARERFPDLASVVISGYEDFSYLQQSMRLGTKDYLLKPVEREELGKLLDRMKTEIRGRAERQGRRSAEEENDPLIRQHVAGHLASCLLRGTIQQEDVWLLRRIGIEFTEPCFTCLVIKLDKDSVDRDRYSRADPSLFQLYIRHFVQEIMDRNGVKGFCFVVSETEVTALLNLPDDGQGEAAGTRLYELTDSIRRQIRSLSNLTITIGLGSIVRGLPSVPRTYREAGIALLYRLIVGGDKVLDYHRSSQENQFKSEVKSWSWEALEDAVNGGHVSRVEEAVASVIRELCRLAVQPEAVYQQISKLLIHYYELSVDMGITRKWLETHDFRSVLMDICSISSIDELIEACQKLLGRLTSCIAAAGRPGERDPVEQALRYMERNFHEHITLKDAADTVFLNPAYFSSLFKQRTGKSFVERLTELRIAEAKKRLARSDDKMAVIAEDTGFLNIRHFNRVFKNETGLTPKEYREQVGRNGGK